MKRFEIIEGEGREAKVVYSYEHTEQLDLDLFKDARRYRQREVPIVVAEEPPPPRGGVRIELTQREQGALLAAAEIIERVLKDAVIVDLGQVKS